MTHRGKPLVLHIDDDLLSRRFVVRVLEPAGFAVAEAGDGASGLASAVQLDPDLVLLDINLPDVSGIEVCIRIRSDSRTRAIPVAHLSAACIDVDWRVEGLEAGADAYLVLPVEPAELIATIRALLRLRRSEEEARRLLRQATAIPRVRESTLGTAAKELSGPVSTIRIAAEGLVESLPPADSVTRARVAAILGAARSIDRVLAALVDLARADAGSLSIPHARMSTSDALAAARELAPGARLRGSAPAPDRRVRCDPSRFRQILAPVLRQVAGEGPGTTPEISIAVERQYFMFSVRSDQSPTAVGSCHDLSESFWSRPHSRRRPELDMALAKAIVEAHGGQMWAAATDGDRGFAVNFTIPASED